MKTYSLFPTFVKGSLPIFSPTPPSQEFSNTVIGGASPVTDCDLCGRVHFDVNGENMEAGELAELLESQQINPHGYVASDGQIHHGCIDEKTAVHGCPCNGLQLYEDFIWNNKHIISRFLTELAKTNLKRAQDDARTAEATATAVKTLR